MDETPIKILLIDDDEDDFVLTRDLLTSYDNTAFSLNWASNYLQGENALKSNAYDIYLIDYRLGNQSGLDLLEYANSLGIAAPIIVLTGKGDRSIDIEAMQLGAADYLVKGEIDARILERAIRYSVEKSRNTKILQEQELKYRTLFERSIDAICITNLEGNISDCNQSFADLFGSIQIAPNGNHLSSLFVDKAELFKFENELKKTGVVKNVDVSLKSKDGLPIICSISAVELPASVNLSKSLQIIIRDISKIKQTEEDLRRAEKLAITGKLARTIAHEVRNPLTNIALSIDQLANERPQDELIDFYVKIASRNLTRINNLITELLNSAKPSELNLEEEDINWVLEQTIELTRDRLQLQNIQLDTELNEDIPLFPIDKEKMQTALLNIIINAIEAMETDKGILTIKTGFGGNKCWISIADNGCGISKENMGQLFDAFYTGKKNGMGLGLTTTQNIILGHKGKIQVASEIGKGTEFKLVFDIEN
ncbi:MAG: ATP-binding protein [Chitinophagales bacterium]|nr:ATP-binding protein [Chitinophagales bacterium]